MRSEFKPMLAKTVLQRLQGESATYEFAKKLASYCRPGMVIFLQGPLGAGKTTFVRSLLQHLGYNGRVKSPTYTLIEPYTILSANHDNMQYIVYHFDLYRLSDPRELYYLGVDDYFSQDTICLIEWPERAEGTLPAPDIEIIFSIPKEIEYRDVRLIIRKVMGG